MARNKNLPATEPPLPTELTTLLEEEAKPAPVVYAGASVPGLRHGTVIDGELPRVINENGLKELCIPVQDFGIFERRRKVLTSRESILYKRSEAAAAEMARR